MEFRSRIVVEGVTPDIQTQSEKQTFNFNDILQKNYFVIKNNFQPTQELEAENNIFLEHSGQKGVTLTTRKSALLSRPVLFFSSYYQQTNPETELSEIIHDNILEMGVLENSITEPNTNETITQKEPYVKMYGKLDMCNNNIKNVSAPLQGTDAVNKDYVDQQIASADLSDYVTNTALQTALHNFSLPVPIPNESPFPYAWLANDNTLDNQNFFSSPLGEYLIFFTSTGIKITKDGRVFEEIPFTTIFGSSVDKGGCAAWYNDVDREYFLLNSKTTVNLAKTSDFVTFTQVDVTNLNFPTKVDNYSFAYFNGFELSVFLRDSVGVYYLPMVGGQFTTISMPSWYDAQFSGFSCFMFQRGLVASDIDTKKLYYSGDKGVSWTVIQENMESFFISGRDLLYGICSNTGSDASTKPHIFGIMNRSSSSNVPASVTSGTSLGYYKFDFNRDDFNQTLYKKNMFCLTNGSTLAIPSTPTGTGQQLYYGDFTYFWPDVAPSFPQWNVYGIGYNNGNFWS